VVLVVPASPAIDASFAGSEACAGCHAEAYSAWQASQHARAMQHATAATVLGSFSQATFRYAGFESTFYQRNDRFFVRTDGADGKLADFEIRYTFGIEPLQQYLIAFPDGRLQALSVAWDSRPKETGGQRWFHLYPDDKVDHRDELHWTRRAQNWNFMCADCHSTDVRRNYDAGTDTFHTTWKEIAVGCEACHGPASAHIEWARTRSGDAGKGLTVALAERAGVQWTIDATTGNAVRSRPRPQDTEIGICAQCHSRRSQISDGFRAGLAFQDFYRPALLSPGLYYPDGQQRDEVYTWGSFLQSRMYHAGVTCSDCHEPHGQQLRAAGNALCGTCHQAAKYAVPAHHHHAGEGAGTRCVDCHMPATTYMVVDPRRDHSLRVPRSDQSVALGTPNACNGCHRDRDAPWAVALLAQWYGHAPQGFQRYAGTFADAERGAAEGGPGLAMLAGDPSQPPIARASALEALAQYPAQASVEAARAGLADHDALVRRASVGTLSMLPPAQRLPLVAPLLDDPVRSVRIEAAHALADAVGVATPAQRAAFDRSAAEYESVQRFSADRPEARTALGSFYARQGRFGDAQAQLQSALAVDPAFVPARVNLADLLRVQGRDADAELALRDGLRQAPAAELHHTLGLTLVRLGRNEEALGELQRAAQLAPSDARFAYVYAISLQSGGKTKAAVQEVDRALARHPDNRDLLVAAVTFRRDGGDIAGARRYALRLSRRYPDDPGAAQLASDLGAVP
jgi:tetratricopeptide (TPR) repeat protein